MSRQESKGLTFRVPPEMAAKLRQNETTASAAATTTTTSTTDDGILVGLSNSKKNEPLHETSTSSSSSLSSDPLPIISLDLERLIGYKPPLEEYDSIRSQLLGAMWTRYYGEQKGQNNTDDDGNDNNDNDNNNNNNDNRSKIPPPDFDLQVGELLGTGVATFFGVKEENENDSCLLQITYPPILQSTSTSTTSTTKSIMKTSKLWKDLLIPPTDLEFIARLWKLLRTCSRTLLWKYDMSMELKVLIEEEQTRLEYQEWTESKRQSKLESLYSIRETLVHQLEMAQVKRDSMEEEREDKVREWMQHYYYRQRQLLLDGKGGGGGGGLLESFGTSEMSFPDEFQLLGLTNDRMMEDEQSLGLGSDDDEYNNNNDNNSMDSSSGYGTEEEDDNDDDDDDYYSENDDNGIAVMEQKALQNDATSHGTNESSSAVLTDPVTVSDAPTAAESTNNNGDTPNNEGKNRLPPLADSSSSPALVIAKDDDDKDKNDDKDKDAQQHTLSIPFQKRKERRLKNKRKKRQEKKAAERKLKEEQAKAVEDETRSNLTTKDYILSQTLCNALQGKVDKVEELLESLQDEVWEAEEQQQQQQQQEKSNEETKRQQQQVEDENLPFSLLDQVLAMILGAMPIESGMTPAEHYKKVDADHKELIKDWKKHFGRLPPPAGGASQGNGGTKYEEVATPSAEEKRRALGIPESGVDDWEAEDDGDDDSTAKAATPKEEDVVKRVEPVKEAPKPKLVGLRPGGSIKR